MNERFSVQILWKIYLFYLYMALTISQIRIIFYLAFKNNSVVKLIKINVETFRLCSVMKFKVKMVELLDAGIWTERFKSVH